MKRKTNKHTTSTLLHLVVRSVKKKKNEGGGDGCPMANGGGTVCLM